MPRGVRNRQEEVIDINLSELVDHIRPANLPVSTTLSKEFYRLKKAVGETLEPCPVCLDPVDCPRCFTLLPCSHYICAPCYLRLIGDKACPLCRSI